MRTSKKLYSMTAVDMALEKLMELGYDIIVMEGSLLDDYICVASDETLYNFYFYETFLNSQSSAYKMQRFTKLTGNMAELFWTRFYNQDRDTKAYIEEFVDRIL